MSQVYEGNRESLNKRLLTESYFMRNLNINIKASLFRCGKCSSDIWILLQSTLADNRIVFLRQQLWHIIFTEALLLWLLR